MTQAWWKRWDVYQPVGCDHEKTNISCTWQSQQHAFGQKRIYIMIRHINLLQSLLHVSTAMTRTLEMHWEWCRSNAAGCSHTLRTIWGDGSSLLCLSHHSATCRQTLMTLCWRSELWCSLNWSCTCMIIKMI